MEPKEGSFGAGRLPTRVRLGTTAIIARGMASPLEIEAAERSGVFEAEGLGRDEALLEIGGVIVASGRIVTGRGRSWFKVGKMFTAEESV